MKKTLSTLLFSSFFMLVLIIAVSACGKKGELLAPADQPDLYPRDYPSE